MTDSTETKQQACPECQTILPVYPGFVTWCHQCGWNVNPQEPPAPRNVIESVQVSLGRRQGRAILERYLKADTLRPSLTLSRLLAVMVALMVYGAWLGFGVLGIGILIWGWPHIFPIVGGLVCLGVLWLLRPRLLKMPDNILPRDEFPALYAFVERLSAALGAPKVHSIVVNDMFNASIAEVGWQRRHVLSLGLPLWSVLDDQERVALVSHELAHSVNADPIRGIFVGTAIGLLINSYDLLRPDYRWMRVAGWLRIMTAPAYLLMSALSGIVWVGAYVLILLLWRERQRAEYLADYLAATMSGTDAKLSLLEKLPLAKTFATTLRKIALGNNPDRDLFEELHQNAERVPERERERIRRVLQMEESRLDVSHPPTAYRMTMLRARPVSNPGVVLSASESEQIDSELAATKERLQRLAINRYKAGLYH